MKFGNMTLMEFFELFGDGDTLPSPLQRRFFESKTSAVYVPRISGWAMRDWILSSLGWIYSDKRRMIMGDEKIGNNSEFLTFATEDNVNHPSHYNRGGYECTN